MKCSLCVYGCVCVIFFGFAIPIHIFGKIPIILYSLLNNALLTKKFLLVKCTYKTVMNEQYQHNRSIASKTKLMLVAWLGLLAFFTWVSGCQRMQSRMILNCAAFIFGNTMWLHMCTATFYFVKYPEQSFESDASGTKTHPNNTNIRRRKIRWNQI